MNQRIDPVEIDELKSRTRLSSLFGQYGVKGRGNKIVWAKCCFHSEKSASLQIDDAKGRYHCFGCGAAGDHFTVIEELGGKSFMEAIEVLGGARPITEEERRKIEQRQRDAEEKEKKERQRTNASVDRLFKHGKPIAGTWVEAYLEARAIRAPASWLADLRFTPELTYRGYAGPEDDDTVDLGVFPCMLAAIRDIDDRIIGIHRTYLDPEQPVKLTPPGDQRRNKAKKILGEHKGGMIRLGPLGPRLASGEGIETTLSWGLLNESDDEFSLAASVSLNNMAGSATGTVQHPRNKNLRIPNGQPDEERPGVILPRQVKEAILLGDGDSEPYMTRARLMVGGRRFRSQGVLVSVSMAPDGKDWNNVLEARGVSG